MFHSPSAPRDRPALLWQALLFFLLLLPAVVRAHPLVLDQDDGSFALVPHVEVLEDPGGKLDLAAVRQAAAAGRFAPAHALGELNFGYSSSAFWLRIPLESRLQRSSPWLLEIAFPSLDRVELFLPRADGRVDYQLTGDRLPFAERPYANRNLVLPLELGPGESLALYLRVESEGSLTLPLTLWTPDAFRLHNQDAYAGFSLYYGMLLALGLYNLLLFFALRERIYLVYVAFAVSMAVGQLSLNGLGNEYIWPAFPAWGNVALPSGFAATGFFGAIFTRLFLNTRHSNPRADKLILALAAGFAVAALGPALLPYRWAAILTSLLGAAFSAVAVAVGVHAQLRRHPGARYFLLAWSLLLVGVGMMALRNLGWLPTTLFTSYGMQIGSALEMLLLSFALADRIQAERLAGELAQGEALHSKQDLVNALRSNEQLLEARVAERTRDLAAANDRLLANEQQLQRMARHDPLTGLANRLLLDDRISHGLAVGRRNGTRLALLLIDLDGFKPINDEHGHAVGDQLLVVLADRLQRSVRAVDTVARLGGDEFVLVLEDLAAVEDGRQVAAKVVAEMSRPVVLEGRELLVSASAGLAFYPEDGEDAQTLLRRADEAMYEAKRTGRNIFRQVGQ